MGARRQLAERERLRMKGAWRYFRRRLQRYSQVKIAELCGVSRGVVERWESIDSRRLPDIGDLVALARAMRIDPEDLFRWLMTAEKYQNSNGEEH